MGAFRRQYGEATSVTVPVPKIDDTDFADVADYAYTSGDILVSKDEGTPANISGTPTEIDYAGASRMALKIPLTATEMQAARIDIMIVDAALEDQFIKIETKGHPSAQHPNDGIPLPDSGLITGSPTSTTAALGGNLPATDDLVNGTAIYFSAGTGAGQTRQIVDYDTASDTVTVDPAWTTTPDTTTVYHLLPAAPSPTATANLTPVNATHIEGSDATDQIRDALLDDATRFAGADIAAILTDTAEIGAAGAGLTEAGGTGDQFTAVPWNAAWDVEVQSEVQDALNATFTFTVAGQVDANTLSINSATVTGDGNATPWDGA